MTTLRLYEDHLSGNCHKVRLFLSILGMAYESVIVEVPKGANRDEWFTRINPLQQIPTLTDGEYTVQDSQAILTYLAHRYRPAWGGNNAFEAGEIMQWLSFAANEIANSLQLARVYYAFGEALDIEVVHTKSMRVLRLLDQHLALREWLACGRPTIADLACFPYVGLCRQGRLPVDDFPNVIAWINRIAALEGYVSMSGLPPSL